MIDGGNRKRLGNDWTVWGSGWVWEDAKFTGRAEDLRTEARERDELPQVYIISAIW